MRFRMFLILPLLFLLLLFGCDVLFNSSPDVLSLSAADTELAEGESTTLTATAVDDDGDAITYAYTATIGSLSNSTSSTVTYTAPTWQAGDPTTAVITVEVSDAYTDDIDDTGTATVNITLLGRAKSLAIQVPSSYFTSLSTDSLTVQVNGSSVKTISSSDITSDPTVFTATYYGAISSITFVSGTYSDTFDALGDFAANNDSNATAMYSIKNVRIYPYYNLFTETYIGTGAYVEPES